MTEIDYDCEFLENGSTIELISIGLVAGDGREYYAVCSEIDQWTPEGSDQLHKRITNHRWLVENVVPHLPLNHAPSRTPGGHRIWSLDRSSTLVKPTWVIANEVREFILASDGEPSLWADYGAYDHVRLCQLWGSMVNKPDGIPMWTNDLRQEWNRLGRPGLPSLPGIAEHNALDDARECQYRRRWLAHWAEEAGRQ